MSEQIGAGTTLALPSSPRLVFIDLFRGLAALLVVVQHVADRLLLHGAAGERVLHAVFVDTIDLGRFGVALFFMVSGYVVPFSLGGERPVVGFVRGRFFRLFPAYWASLAAALALYAALGRPASLFAAAMNATMVEMAFGVPPLVGPYWTLIIELAFYGACLLLFVTGLLGDWRTAAAMWLALLSAAVAASVHGVVTGHYGSANLCVNLALMFYGLTVRQADDRGDALLRRCRRVMLAAMLVLVPSILFVAPVRADPLFTPLSFATGYVAAMIVFEWRPLAGGLVGRVLLAFGTVSYSLYLFHDIVLTALDAVVPPDSNPASSVAYAALAGGGSLILAFIAYRLVERPGIAIGRRVGRHSSRRDRSLAASQAICGLAATEPADAPIGRI